MQAISDFIYDSEAGRANITVSTSIYSIEAINTTTYCYLSNYHIILCPGIDKNNTVVVIFEAKGFGRDIKEDLKDFCNTLIDHQVRVQLDLTNGKIRDLIVAHAFSPIDLHKEANSL